MSWSLSDIGNHVEKISSWNPSQSLISESFSYIDLSSIDKDKKVISLKDVPIINPVEAPSRARQIVNANDVLVSTVRPNLNGVAVVSDELEGATASTGYCVLRADNSTLYFRYLYHWVKTNSFIEDMMKKATGANYPAVSDKIIKESKIPLPPLAEQKRIAAILDKADSLRRKNQQAIQLADQFIRAVFLDMFGDPVTNPKGWQKEPLANHFKIGTGGTPSRAIQENYGGNIPWVKTTEVCGRLILETGEALTERGLADSNCKVYPIGSLIIAMYGQGKTRGQCGILGLEASTNQACAVLEPSETLEMNFVYQYIKYSYDQLRELSRGGNQPNLNLSLVKSFEVMIPDKKLQIHFSNIFLRVQEILKQSNDFKDDNLFNSLSQKAFAGEL